jgi:hypothetical protein
MMKSLQAAFAAFVVSASALFLLFSPVQAKSADLIEMYADGNGAQFVITNQPCEIDFHEPTPFKYHAYVVLPDGQYAACWYGNDAAIWMAIDHFKQIVSLDPNAFRVKPPEPKQESF